MRARHGRTRMVSRFEQSFGSRINRKDWGCGMFIGLCVQGGCTANNILIPADSMRCCGVIFFCCVQHFGAAVRVATRVSVVHRPQQWSGRLGL
jgi:hypothetical protein